MSGLVALSDIKGHLNLDPDATDQDDYLTALLAAATRRCEQRIGRAVDGSAETLTLDRFPGSLRWADPQRRDRTILLPGPVAAIASLTCLPVAGSAMVLDPASYVVDITRDPARVGPVGAWPATAAVPGAVTIAFTRVPLADSELAMVAHAIRLLVGGWFANREATATERFTPDELPLSVTWLLDPLRSVPVVQP